MNLNLKNKVAIVTGSTGICKEIALKLAEEGANGTPELANPMI